MLMIKGLAKAGLNRSAFLLCLPPTALIIVGGGEMVKVPKSI